ncbi:MAG: AAA family ATPase [Chlorobiaceae bacterium]|nr:AAA family ATPase [Chlorobiaceae bacterium]
MRKIGKTVLLAGRNGSGKTRILNLIRKQVENLAEFHKRKLAIPSDIMKIEKMVETWQNDLEKMLRDSPDKEVDILSVRTKIKIQSDQISRYREMLERPDPITMDLPSQNISVVDFVPRGVYLADWANSNKQDWMEKANKAKQLGVEHLTGATLPLIQKVMDRWVNTTHPGLSYSDDEKNVSLDDYERLQTIIHSFLGTKIGWNKDGYSTIFDKPIAKAQLSDGQCVILQLCIAIYAQGGTLSNHVIFMDEPENHLHPSAVIDLLDAIKAKNPDGQIWIATHSIPLLSHFDESAIWFVEDGEVSHAGKKPERVLKGLLGDEDRISRLRDFTNLPAELARNRFAFECLCPSSVVETDSTDPQTIQLYEQLKVIWSGKKTIRLLDFGAGKGRLIANLSDYENVSPDSLDYYSYDLNHGDKETCLKNISNLYNNPEARYFNSIEEIRSHLDDKSFDVIVMCNVLHEIRYSDWCNLFNSITALLKDDGYLLLIEDCRIPIGELPHVNGFLVLSTLHLKKLFKIPANENRFIRHDARFNSTEQRGRLMAHLIPVQYLTNASAATISESLAELKTTAMTEILRIRNSEKSESSYASGLAHSFWVQQLANATLCLSELGYGA